MPDALDSGPSSPPRSKRDSALAWLSLLGLLIGLAGGELIFRTGAAHTRTAWIDALAFIGNTFFLGPLRAVLAPLIVCSILSGIGSIRQSAGFRRLVALTLILFWSLMLLGAAWGAFVVTIVRPGNVVGSDLTGQVVVADASRDRIGTATGLGMLGAGRQLLTEIFTTNPVTAAAEGRLLPIVAFSIALGLALVATGDKGQPALQLAQSLFAGLMRLVTWILWLAPLGVASLAAAAVARIGTAGIAGPLALYVVTITTALLTLGLLGLPAVYALLTRQNPFRVLWAVRPALLTAFSSASSGATIPVTLNCMPAARIDPRIAEFVIPFGTAGQLVGTAVFQGAAVAFLFQVYHIPLSAADLLVLVITTWLAAMSCAGIPSAAIVAMVVIIETINGLHGQSSPALPVSAVVLVLAVDRLIDMLRTTLNVWTHVVVAGIVARRATVATTDSRPGTSPATPELIGGVA